MIRIFDRPNIPKKIYKYSTVLFTFTVCPRSLDPFYKVSYSILCDQEVVTPIYIMSYYINWGNYFLDTR